jgi:hypothetical protein
MYRRLYEPARVNEEDWAKFQAQVLRDASLAFKVYQILG